MKFCFPGSKSCLCTSGFALQISCAVSVAVGIAAIPAVSQACEVTSTVHIHSSHPNPCLGDIVYIQGHNRTGKKEEWKTGLELPQMVCFWYSRDILIIILQSIPFVSAIPFLVVPWHSYSLQDMGFQKKTNVCFALINKLPAICWSD